MLRILGRPRTFCDGITRRDLLHASGRGLLGSFFQLPSLAVAERAASARVSRQSSRGIGSAADQDQHHRGRAAVKTVTQLLASPYLLGRRIDLSWQNPPASDFDGGPGFARIRIVRRERTYPETPDDGDVTPIRSPGASGPGKRSSIDRSHQRGRDDTIGFTPTWAGR